MNVIAIWAASGLFALQAGVCIRAGQFPQAAILSGYVIANLGLIWSMS